MGKEEQKHHQTFNDKFYTANSKQTTAQTNDLTEKGESKKKSFGKTSTQKKDSKQANNLTFSRNEVFQYVLVKHPDIAQKILELLTGKVLKEFNLTREYSSTNDLFKSKSSRFDVFVKGGNKTVFDIEAQVRNDKSLAKRIRYYQSQLDVSLLDRQDPYKKLLETYIIFICTHDPLKKGLPIYTFEPICLENKKIKLVCDMHWIIVNSKAYYKVTNKNKDLSQLLEYIATNKPNDNALVRRIDDIVHNFTDEEKAMIDAATMDKWDAEVLAKEAKERWEARGFRKGESRGRKAGLKEGRKEGETRGEARYAELVDELLKHRRFDDLRRASSDQKFRQSLFIELGI